MKTKTKNYYRYIAIYYYVLLMILFIIIIMSFGITIMY